MDDIIYKLIEDYNMICLEEASIHAKLVNLPKGSIQKKTIRGRTYNYLSFRENEKVKSQYVPDYKLGSIYLELEQASELKNKLKEVQRMRRLVGEAIGEKYLVISRIQNAVKQLATDYQLKKVTLFGSRATDKFRPDSDVDLIVEFIKPVGMFTLAELKADLEQILCLEVDVIYAPLPKDSILEIGNTEAIYAAP